jgi:outer membrane protein
MNLGCRVDQAKEVATYRQILDAGVPAARFVRGAPVSLEEALALANQHNEQLGLAGETYLQALINKDRAAATFLPTVSLSPSYFYESRVRTGTGNLSHGQFDVPAHAGMNVFNGFSDLASYRVAGQTIARRRALLLDAQAVVLLDVAATYYQILRSERLVEVLKNSLAVQAARVRDTRVRERAGVGRALEVAQVEAQEAGTQASLIAAQNEVVNGRSLLAFLAGAPLEESPLNDQAMIPDGVPGREALQEQAYAQRQDLAAAEAAIAAARNAVDAAIGQYYPSVTLDVSTLLYSANTSDEGDWTALLRANVPIFSAGLIHAGVREAWSVLRQTQLEESRTRRLVLLDVQTAYQNLLSSRKRIEQLRVLMQSAEQALRLAEQSYQAGWATNLDRLAAQSDLLTAQLELASEQFNQKVSYMRLLRATGRLSTRLPGEPATGPATQPATNAAAPGQ